MPKSHNKIVGSLGEDFAARYLQSNGYEILERNWGSKWGEIDIIARDGKTIIFIEVKTKIGSRFGSPEEMVRRRKLIQIQRIASSYPLTASHPLRLDVIAVILKADKTLSRLTHHQAVY